LVHLKKIARPFIDPQSVKVDNETMGKKGTFNDHLAVWKEEYDVHNDTLHSICPPGISERARRAALWQRAMVKRRFRKDPLTHYQKKKQKKLNATPGWKWEDDLFAEQVSNYLNHKHEKEGREAFIANFWFDKITKPFTRITPTQQKMIDAIPEVGLRALSRMAGVWSADTIAKGRPPNSSSFLGKWHSALVANKENLSEEYLAVLHDTPAWTWEIHSACDGKSIGPLKEDRRLEVSTATPHSNLSDSNLWLWLKSWLP
jgi:hypothetical protein